MDELIQRLHPKNAVLYRDKDVLVIHKAEGVLSHASDPSEANDAAFRAPYDESAEEFRLAHYTLRLMHRLDRETSGCLLFAFTQRAAKALRQAFQDRQVKKTYVALVKGAVQRPTQWRDALVKREGRVSRVRGEAPNALTDVTPRGAHTYPPLQYLELHPLTGKTHQLRVQAALRGHPIVGDRLYGDFKLNAIVKTEIGLRRMCLHASYLEFKHPVSGKVVRVTSEAFGF